MVFEKHIEDVNKNFYYTTHTPIQAYTFDGYLINKVGYNQGQEMILDYHNIYDQVKEKLKSPEKPITIKTTNDMYFAATSICPRSLHRGLFIIGPYSKNKDNDMGIVYKPGDVFQHLISFLRILYKDCNYNRNINKNNVVYSFHIKKAIDYIDARFSSDISLDEISDYLGINKSYFCTLFKDETGYTFTQYLNQVRIDKSKRLLQEEDMSILDIALAVGFNNQNYFNIMFKRLTGETPLGYKRSQAQLDKRFVCMESC